MSGFLLVVPEGYIEIDAEELMAKAGIEAEYFVQMLEAGSWWELNPIIEVMGYVADGFMVIDAQVFNTGAGKKLWIRQAPEA